ncbi:hypothetical protein SAMN02745146_1953 [Hymenobacter daecheongensis DSM 21074]|uniref:Uncharacterized protein n=1 Tax=Hymenobacter daecheongensis DSM 21074 TaxID=1121955 RepID=A0A1M6F6C7_9BACT|nr:hypothetical protein [Hymenobacter daecheongensis]SHI93278.1 hypothetical protein SAMN02745146_1953 [Hymenobacter daecheongensis DSM 21074]
MRPYRYLPFMLLLSGLAACTGTQTAVEKSAPNASQPSAMRPAMLDMPALMGRNIDQVRRALGPPTETKTQAIGIEPTPEQMRSTKGEDWINTFEKNGSTVVVTFNARTRKVLDMVLIGAEEDELMRRGNLSLTAPDYLVLPVADPKNANKISGLRVVSRR